MKILVFPSCLNSCLSMVAEARRHGEGIIGASSLDADPFAGQFDAWERLPYLQDPGFSTALSLVLRRHAITHVFTSHSPTYRYLALHPEVLPGGVTLMGPAPYEHQSELVRTVWSGINEAIEKVNYYAGKTTGYAPAFLASLLHYFYSIYGECQEEKALAFCGILADAPVGDVVEIGTFFGKSAFLLTRLSAHLGLGPVLAVDSWDMQTSVQTDSPTEIQSLSTVWDWKLVFDGFLVTMAASATGREFNYLRQRSAEAWETYDSAVPIHSPEFGETRMTGKIGLLHIDGNHDETSVRLDFDLWRRRLADGGWVVFDDYTWSHGDGPRKVADQVIGELRQQILRRFISGGALFIKIAQEH